MRTIVLAVACATLLADPAAALEGARRQITLHPVSAWTKICGKDKMGKDVCYTSRNFGVASGRPPTLALAVYDIEGVTTHVLRFLLPVGLRTDLGLTFSIDGGDRQAGQFKICFPNGCFAEAKCGMPLLASMRRGGTMQITTTDAKNRRVDLYLSLAGLAAAYDGRGVDYHASAPRRKDAPRLHGAPGTNGTSI